MKLIIEQSNRQMVLTCKFCGSDELLAVNADLAPAISVTFTTLQAVCENCGRPNIFKWTLPTNVKAIPSLGD